MRHWLIYLLLLAVKGFSRALYRVDLRWLGDPPAEPWRNVRLVAFLNHTSLWEPLFAGGVPNAFLRDIARRGVIPAADITLARPLVGRFFRSVGRRVVSVSRERDQTWRELLERVEPDSLVIILPEGRMKRADGLDKHGRPMTVRGGVADVLRAMPSGRMLLAYSGGLHHVQVPGQGLPRLFKTIRMRVEALDIDRYRQGLTARAAELGFKRAVIADLEERRDRHCPPLETPRRGRGRSPRPARDDGRDDK